MNDLVLTNITKRFGKTAAVDHVSLEIKGGSLFFLLGPSGCGKTTLLRMIAGFYDLDEGEIFLGGRSLKTVPPGKRNTAMVFQNYALWPHLNVHQNVAYGLEERRIPRERRAVLVREALQNVQMEAYEFRKPNELSGGQQQRVALARALVVDPEVILLDEPLSNLDAKLRMEMRHEIRRIHDRTGVTMIYVTHDQKEALTMADEIAVMSMGRIEQIAAPRTVYKFPANLFVANFLGEANLIPGLLRESDGDYGILESKVGNFTGRLGNGCLQKGGDGWCLIRPECLRVSAEEENRITARVEQVIFLGESEQVIYRADTLTLKTLSIGAATGAVSKGEEVRLSFGREEALLLPRERDKL